jgi:hypothetical protein
MEGRSRMNRRDTDTLRVKAAGFDAIYIHLEYVADRPVKLRISSPGKYSDQSLGVLLDAISDRVTAALRVGDQPRDDRN